MDSPLLFPVTLAQDTIRVLDETRLPFAQEYIEVKEPGEALDVLAKMKTRSLGQVLLFFYGCVLFCDRMSPGELARQFKEHRPTFDFLFLSNLIEPYAGSPRALAGAVGGFVKKFDAARKTRAKTIAEILPREARILTICNVNGELIYLFQALTSMGKTAAFYACETRPYLQGSRLTFWELQKNNIPCYLFCDHQAAGLMKEAKVNCVITGADRATRAGDIINKTGTYALARLAKHFAIPVYALTQYPRDIDVSEIEIEERDPAECFMYLDQTAKYDAIYPAFDVIGSEYITRSFPLPMSR